MGYIDSGVKGYYTHIKEWLTIIGNTTGKSILDDDILMKGDTIENLDSNQPMIKSKRRKRR